MDQLLHPSDTVDLARVARLVRPFETLEHHAVRRSGGGWSIGYGHIQSAREGATVTREEAEALLIYDLRHAAKVVRSAICAPINRNQLEALTAFAFHIGTENFLRSTALHRFNAGDGLGAAQELERWCRADLGGDAQVGGALVRRRAAEKAHFLTPPQGFPKVSRARVRPQVEAPSAGMAETDEAAPSAVLAAAQGVSARLRALVPDVEDPGASPPWRFETGHAERQHAEPQHAEVQHVRAEQTALEPIAADPAEPATAANAEAVATQALAEIIAEPHPAEPEPVLPALKAVEPIGIAAAAAAAPELFEAFAPPESEIPPPPMPFEVAAAAAPHVAPQEPARPDVDRIDPETFDVWPSFRPTAGGDGDPFAQGPLDGASIEAPPLDRPAPKASLFRARAEPSLESVPRPEPAGRPLASSPVWARIPRAGLWVCLAIGVAIFVWSIWSIFKTSPVLVNFVAGLVGIAVMAAPAYLLLGARPPRSN